MLGDLRADGVICFGGGDWWYHNRAHIDMQVLRRYAADVPVVYVNSLVVQSPQLKRGSRLLSKVMRKGRSILKGLQKVDHNFWVFSPLVIPAHTRRIARAINNVLMTSQMAVIRAVTGIRRPLVWLTCPTATDCAVGLTRERLVYQRADRWEEFPNVNSAMVRRLDQTAKQVADLTVFVNEELFEEERAECKAALYLDHGVDFDRFAQAELDPYVPADIRDIPHPIIGFFGGIDSHTSDVALIERVVTAAPDLTFVFIGSASTDCSGFESRPNVCMLGRKEYELIPHYGKCFDVAIMPWNQNEWIRACNPIKLKEYLALGKPIVSRPFPQLQRYADLVYQAVSPEEFCASLERALAEESPELVSRRRARVCSDTWSAKAATVLEHLRVLRRPASEVRSESSCGRIMKSRRFGAHD